MKRREFLRKAAGGVAGLAAGALWDRQLLAAPYINSGQAAQKVFVLGLDGMDPILLRRFVQRGEMPNFARLMERGYCGRLATTMPAQSPVAWSSFITGTNPGGNGIFDFIHRDPATFTPYLSTSRTSRAGKSLEVGSWSIPLDGDRYELMRRGRAFWHFLEEAGIPTTLFKAPANFPVEPGPSRAISGMGTPDVLGTYGTFTYFTDAEAPGAADFTGGRVVRVEPLDHVVRSVLEGPPNPLRADKRSTQIDFTARRDPREKTVRIEIQGHQLVMRQGEWSEWLPLKFEVLPLFSSVAGMVRLYAQEVHPHFRLYMSPINVDPMDAEIPISNPTHYSQALSEAVGRFYTQGFPEDTKALSNGIFSSEEFLQQSKIVFAERRALFEHEIDGFDEGLFFFYFSSLDQNSHMLYRTMDPGHPLYEPDASPQVKDGVYHFYRAMDDVLGKTLSRMDGQSTLIVLSDHGFAPFTREFHLSTWLVENGYTAVADPDWLHEGGFFAGVDWEKTRAFALGLNGLYINLQDREVNGAVAPGQAAALKKEIVARLNQVRDPENGGKVIRRAYDSREIYSGPYLDIAPDIVVGYEGGYRISDAAALGGFPRGTIGDRTDKWSADHCLEPSVVPGVLLSNRAVGSENPGIWDLGPSILARFGLEIPAEMEGRAILGDRLRV